ncbi:MAG: FHA domain-containing protein [Thermoleophilaceae bacterium]|nr:FHA domain-containing protein [Thermoleophilaceae bacterium]
MTGYVPGRLELLLSSPLKRRGTRLLAGLVYRAASTRASVGWAWRTGRAPRLALPRDRDRFFVGRGPGCDCLLPDDTVSRRHALLLRRRGAWTVEDLGSLNGTLLNGWPVVIPTEVRAGDVLTFGGVSYRVSP